MLEYDWLLTALIIYSLIVCPIWPIRWITNIYNWTGQQLAPDFVANFSGLRPPFFVFTIT